MKVYRLIIGEIGKDAQKSILLSPYIPNNRANGENSTTPRIPCSLTIMGCITSLSLPFIYEDYMKIRKSTDNRFIVHLYGADVSVDNIYQPTNDQVPDEWLTGELWLTKDTEFIIEKTYELNRHIELPGFPYSRYSMTQIDDMIVDRVGASVVYGDIDNFSFIYLNKDRMEKGLEDGSFVGLIP